MIIFFESHIEVKCYIFFVEIQTQQKCLGFVERQNPWPGLSFRPWQPSYTFFQAQKPFAVE